MNKFKKGVFIVLIFTFITCGKNELKEKLASTTENKTKIDSNLNSNNKANEIVVTNDSINTSTTIQTTSKSVSASKKTVNKTTTAQATIYDSETKPNSTVKNQENRTAKVIDSPLKIFLKKGEIGKTYTKKDLIENFKFPKEAVDLVKKVTYTGPNTIYFNWGSTWLVEKVSDAKFKNGNLTFVFKENKTFITGGAIGIKYNKKVYTELIINNGDAYIPSVKGYHWEINK